MTATVTSVRPRPAAGTVSEFVTEDSIDALNQGLADRGIDASRIIAIFKLAGSPLANGAPARFRVLYRLA